MKLAIVQNRRETLDPDQRRGLANLLDIAQRLPHLVASPTSIRLTASDIEDNACAVAGIGKPPESDVERVFLSLGLDRPTTKLWSSTLELPGDDVAARFYDAPSRTSAIANGLVLLAATLLRKTPDEYHQHWFAGALDDIMEAYDERLVPKEPPSQSFIDGSGID